MQRVVAQLMRLQRGHGYDAVVDLADRTQVLACDMVGGAAILALARVVDNEHAIGSGGGQGIGAEQLQRACRNRVGRPGRFGQKEL